MNSKPHTGRATFWRALVLTYGATAIVVVVIMTGAADALLRALG